MSTQLIGFAIGGICKRILVAPPSMIWPDNLVIAALLNTLHTQETLGTRSHGGISCHRLFTYVFVGYYFYSQPLRLGNLCLNILITHCHRFLALLSLHCSLKLLLGLLDSSQQS
jgi:OPT oligopeptide transporter protein